MACAGWCVWGVCVGCVCWVCVLGVCVGWCAWCGVCCVGVDDDVDTVL